jgi:ribonuclease P protein component
VGFTTSKKVGDAVNRNRARRRLRAAVDIVFPGEAQTGRDYVVIGRAATVTRPFDLLLADLRAALKRLGARR